MIWHILDRGLLSVTAWRFMLCAVAVWMPALVGVPTHMQPVSVVYFLPMIFGVLGALSLRESIQWWRPKRVALVVCRGALTLVSDAVCLLGLFITMGDAPERLGVLAGCALAMAAGLATACVSQDYAWLAAAFVGLVCLLSVDRAVVLYLPVAGCLVVYVLALCVYAVLGPTSSGAEGRLTFGRKTRLRAEHPRPEFRPRA